MSTFLSPVIVHLLLVGGGLVATVVGLAWTLQNRDKHATAEFGLFLGTVVLWAAAQLVEVIGGPQIAYVASFAAEAIRATMAVSWFYFTMTYAGHGSAVHSGAIRLSAAASTIYLLVFTGVPPVATAVTFDTVSVTHTPFTAVAFRGANPFHHLAQLIGYLLVGIGTIALVYRLVKTEYTRAWQSVVFLATAFAVLTFDLLIDDVISPVPGVDYAVIGTSVVSVIYILVLYRGDLFGFAPVARDHVFHNMDDGVVVVNPDHTIIDVNPAAASMLGDEVQIGSDAEAVLPDEIATDARVTNLTDGRTNVTLTENGTARHYDVIVSTLTPGEELSGIAIILRDTTERMEREQKLRRFRRAVASAGDAIFITDPDGVIEYVNPAFEGITGYSRAEAVGNTPQILDSGEMTEDYFAQLWATIRSGDVWDKAIVNQRKDGDRYHAHQTIAPFTDGSDDIEGFVAVQRDLTARKEREQHLQVLSRVLRHNLKNDMTVIQGRAETIHTEASGTVETAADMIIEKSDELINVAETEQAIIDILVEAPDRIQIELVSLLQRSATTVTDRHPEATIDVNCPAQPTVVAIPQLGDAVTELLTNATIHTEQDSPEITVTVTRDAAQVHIEIADNGPRIPEMERQILVEGTESGPLSHGNGLGLWLVYWVVTRSDGTVTVAEAEPRGNIIRITLPGERTESETEETETNT
ncbi:MAG: PAS domain S-box protein [Haloarcula sp.]